MLAAGCVLLALALWEFVGWFGLAWLYLAVSFVFLSVAYGGGGVWLLGKQPSGRRALWAWLLFGPYFILNALIFRCYRLVAGKPAYIEVAPNVFLGRRLLAGEATTGGWIRVLDLAAEFAETPSFRELAGYKSVPLLDAMAPTEEQLRSSVAWLTEGAATGPVYVHCALGHGRSACVVLAYWLAVGKVTTIAEGMRQLRVLRPGVRLHPCQRQSLRAFEPQASTEAGRLDTNQGLHPRDGR